MMSADLIREIIIGLFLAGAVYGGIRADLLTIHAHLRQLQASVTRAHVRLDGHLDKVRAE